MQLEESIKCQFLGHMDRLLQIGFYGGGNKMVFYDETSVAMKSVWHIMRWATESWHVIDTSMLQILRIGE